jgi:hypothetical protein
MRIISCVVVLFAAFGTGTSVGEEFSQTAPNAGAEPGHGSSPLKPIAAPRDAQPSLPLTAHVYRLEGAAEIVLDAKVINEWGTATLTSPGDEEVEALLRKLHKAKVIRETNSVSFFVADGVDATPVLCRRDVMNQDGMQSFEAAFRASVLSPGNVIRISLHVHDTNRGTGGHVQSREVDTGFDIGPKQSLVYRAKYPKRGEPDGEWLVWITRGMIRPTSYSSRGFIADSQSADTVSSTSTLSPELIRYIEELPPPRPRVTR